MNGIRDTCQVGSLRLLIHKLCSVLIPFLINRLIPGTAPQCACIRALILASREVVRCSHARLRRLTLQWVDEVSSSSAGDQRTMRGAMTTCDYVVLSDSDEPASSVEVCWYWYWTISEYSKDGALLP